jgi:hypothetical protein
MHIKVEETGKTNKYFLQEQSASRGEKLSHHNF